MARRQHNYLQLKTHIITSMLLIARSNINVSWFSAFFFFFVLVLHIVLRLFFRGIRGWQFISIQLLIWLDFFVCLGFFFSLHFPRHNTAASSECIDRLPPLFFSFVVCLQGSKKHKRFNLPCSKKKLSTNQPKKKKINCFCKDFA